MKKKCCKCKDFKDIAEEFYKDDTKNDGVNAYCKVCSKDNMNDYYQKNKDKWKNYYKKRKERKKSIDINN